MRTQAYLEAFGDVKHFQLESRSEKTWLLQYYDDRHAAKAFVQLSEDKVRLCMMG